MRFGLFIPQGWRLDLTDVAPERQWDVMSDLARDVDQGAIWESVWVYDHFHTYPTPTEQATHEAWSLMAALGAVTSRVRLGQMCTCMGYRQPTYLAKVAATIDVVTGGRVEMGIGAGWYTHEWEAYGYGFPRDGLRLEMLREGVEIFRQMWTTGEATVDGSHYQVKGALGYPRPLQGTTRPGSAKNGIPLWIAGGGEKKTLRIAAEYADYTNFFGDVEGFTHKSEVLKGHCADVGRDFSEITRSSNYNVVIGRDEAEVADRIRFFADQLVRGGVPTATMEEWRDGLAKQPLVGTPEQICERLQKLQDVGLGYAILWFQEAATDRSGIELFEREVAPSFLS